MAKASLRPRCFDAEAQFDAWREAARATDLPASAFCTDCTAQYQRRMHAQGRCERPDVVVDGCEGGPQRRRRAPVSRRATVHIVR